MQNPLLAGFETSPATRNTISNRTYAAPTAGGVLNPACSALYVRYYGKMRKSYLKGIACYEIYKNITDNLSFDMPSAWIDTSRREQNRGARAILSNI